MAPAPPHDPGRGLRKAAAYAPRRVAEALAEFRRLNSRGAKAAFADHWIGLWARDFDDAWPMVYELMRIVEEEGLFRDPRRVGPGAAGGPATHGDESEYATFADYFEDRVKRPFKTWADLEATYHYVGRYSPEFFNKPFSTAQRAQELEGKTINAGDGPLAADEKANRNNVTVSQAGVRGNHPDYLTRRIARDHPQIFERMKAGEFPSVRAAALEAGIVKRTQSVRLDDPESAARSLRKHMSPMARAELARLLAED